METPESQAIVNAACEQVECVILKQIALQEENKLIKDEVSYQTLREEQAKLHQVPRPTMNFTVT